MLESDNGDIREEVPVFEPADMSQKRSCGGRDVGRAWAAYGQWFGENGKAAQPKVAATAPVIRRMIKDHENTCSRRVCDASTTRQRVVLRAGVALGYWMIDFLLPEII
jgi:hypothetical protein